MGWISNMLHKRKEKWHENAIKGAKREAYRRFQIREYNHLLWLTHDGQLIVPFNMVCGGTDSSEFTALLNAIRDLYVERTVGDDEK